MDALDFIMGLNLDHNDQSLDPAVNSCKADPEVEEFIDCEYSIFDLNFILICIAECVFYASIILQLLLN